MTLDELEKGIYRHSLKTSIALTETARVWC